MKKKIIILGAGESGAGAAVLAQQKGFEVFVSDFSEIKPKYKQMLIDHKIEFEEKTHEGVLRIVAKASPCGGGLEGAEVIKSPGISDKVPIVQKLLGLGIPVISEIEFAGRYTDAKMICITGTNGKTTTALLTYHILKNAGLNVGLAGNVGQSFALQVAQNSFDYYVLEVSSYQLDGMTEFKADIAVLLNITPDHLDRYEFDFQKYVDSKFRIIQNQTENDAFIFWENDPVLRAEITKREIRSTLYPFALERSEKTKAFIENEQLVIKILNSILTMPVSELAAEGTHNIYNSMASGLTASILELRKNKIRESLRDFQGVEHRLEYVATVRNVRFINDSKATNVNSCWYALQSMKVPTVLILGGEDKGNDYREIEKLVHEKVRALVFMGLDNKPLRDFFGRSGKQILEVHTMEDAVKTAYELAHEGDTVLLSPACASFDLFENYEDRGRQFKKYVRNL